MVGDWNANVGKIKEENIVGLYGLGNQNEAGKWVNNFLMIKKIINFNDFFIALNIQNHTYTVYLGITRCSTEKSNWLNY